MLLIGITLVITCQRIFIARIPGFTFSQLPLGPFVALHAAGHILGEVGQRGAIEDLLCPGHCLRSNVGHETLPGSLDSFFWVALFGPKLHEGFFTNFLFGQLRQHSFPIGIAHLHMIHAPWHLHTTRELTPHHIVVTQIAVGRHILAVAGVIAFLRLKHRHQGNDAMIFGIVTPGADVVQQVRWQVQTIAFFNGCIPPSGASKFRPSLQVDPFAIDGRIV
mmetsp:Transcript_73180/g.161534  ORF Transcript_73180/g.161534 Transcript_73180/m.161534 type:complete len:220 (-) Transcript_73180:885-1544(-)